MTDIFDTRDEYAIEVPGRGYVDPHPTGTSLTQEAMPLIYEEDARRILKTTQNHYRNMGVPEVGETVRIVRRTVTVTRDGWEPL